eukprot:Ihof_evm2s982 gene=Ihof_evmTU2s982
MQQSIFTVTQVEGETKGRRGELHYGSSSGLATPTFMAYTSRGAGVSLTNDNMEATGAATGGVCLSLSNAYEIFPTALLKTKGFQLHKFLNMEGKMLFLTIRDSLVVPPEGYNEDRSVSLVGPAGRKKVTVKDYASLVGNLHPDMYCALADVATCHVGAKRHRKAVDRTLLWLDELLKHPEIDQSKLLGTIVGGCGLEERKRAAKEVAARPVAGFVVEGFGMGENPLEHDQLLSTILAELPNEKVRVIHGVNHPESILNAVALGLDVFDATYPVTMTESGYGVVWTYGSMATCEDCPAPIRKINLWDTDYQRDSRAIMPGCDCFTCTNHKRAYIHHLLLTHEMLAEVLLL